MSVTASAGRRQRRAQARPRRLPPPNSAWWLVAVAAAYTVAQLADGAWRMGLSWDETVYVSQLSSHAPAAFFDAARARGVPLLVAPVAWITSSVLALRVYLGLLSGLGLAGALWVWRPLRPAWVLALAGALFGSLWVALYYGPQAMPDNWVALTALAAVGFFLRAAGAGDGTAAGRRRALAGLTLTMAAAALLRPGDAAFLAAPLAVAAVVVRPWRRWQLLACVAGGAAAGAAEWVIEAYARFGSLAHRLRIAGAEQGGLGLHFSAWAQLRALNGPTLCRPCTVGWRYPEISLWWLALPVLVVAGVLIARRAGRMASSLLPAVCGAAMAAQYLILISYAAPRFLLPAYALLAIPVADLLAHLLTGVGSQWREVSRAAVVVLLTGQVMVQLVVLHHQVGGTTVFHNDYRKTATKLARLGVRPPCLVKGDQYLPIAYLAGCASQGGVIAALAARQPAALLVRAGHRPPGYAHGWRHYPVKDARILRLDIYLPPAGPAPTSGPGSQRSGSSSTP